VDGPRSCQFQHLDWGGGRGGCWGRFSFGILRGFGRGFSFPEGWRSRGLGGHEFSFSFSFGGRVYFSFKVGGFKSLNIYFWLLEV